MGLFRVLLIAYSKYGVYFVVGRQSAMTRSAAYMADYANRYHCEVTFAVDSYAWLSTDHLKLPTNLSQKLASHYVGPFKVIE